MLIVSFSIFVQLVAGQTDFEVDGIRYRITDAASNKVSVVSSTGTYSGSTYSGDITIPSTVSFSGKEYRVTYIGSNAFHDCTGLTAVSIPKSVTGIGESAFSDCTSLASVFIPSSIAFIEPWAFTRCTAYFEVDSDNLFFASKDGILYNRNFTTLIQCPISYENDFTVPATLKTIDHEAFYECTGLTSITIPFSIVTIGINAFKGCTGLRSITIPYSVTSIGISAFSGCTGLTSVDMYASVKSIGSSAFSGCTGLSNMYIPPSVTELGGGVFSDCTALIVVDPTNPAFSSKDGILYDKNMTTLIHCPSSIKKVFGIPLSVRTIGYYAFYGCSDLTSITLPTNVSSIGYYAFYGCSGLTSITLPNSLTAVGSWAFSRCTNLPNISIPSSVNYIDNDAFYYCPALISVDPKNPTYASKDGVLYDKNFTTLIQCPNSLIDSFYIPSTVNKIENYAFCSCAGLKFIQIPESVMFFGYNSFFGCTGLSTIVSKITSPTNMPGPDTFGSTITKNCTLFVPPGTSNLYKTASGWKDFKKILELDATELGMLGADLVKIYPNPTTKFVQIVLEEQFDSGILKIVSLSGQQFFEMSLKGNTVQVDVSTYPKGLYFVQATNRKNRLRTIGRFIRN